MTIRAPLAAVLAALLTVSTATAETRVIDGDTLEIDGTIFRLNGIDAPEHGQRCGDWECGAEATRTLSKLLKGARVRCSPIEEDVYGRIIATCYANGRDLSAEMIDKGLAWAFVKYSEEYVQDELVGRDKAEGVFADDFLAPWDFRDLRWKRAEAEEQEAPPGCPIKGNISFNSGDRIYHMPWSPWYSRTYINTAKGERWFCDEAEAIAAGWRAPYWN
ncbi:MAG: thermonuclease family protein [Paracoccaceae bacterium]|nr:thermonuclease family protein [Paracoccaceae bacterium]